VFDPFDIVANIAGSLAAIGLSSWYHKRMLERRRLAKQYQPTPGAESNDPELGEGVIAEESGMLASTPLPSLEAEVDNWNENAEDAWDEEPVGTDSAEGEEPKTPSASSAGEG
jgi:hypothetical protein